MTPSSVTAAPSASRRRGAPRPPPTHRQPTRCASVWGWREDRGASGLPTGASARAAQLPPDHQRRASHRHLLRLRALVRRPVLRSMRMVPAMKRGIGFVVGAIVLALGLGFWVAYIFTEIHDLAEMTGLLLFGGGLITFFTGMASLNEREPTEWPQVPARFRLGKQERRQLKAERRRIALEAAIAKAEREAYQ